MISIIAICLLASVANAMLALRSISSAAALAFTVGFLLTALRWTLKLLLPREIATLDLGLLLLNTCGATGLIGLWCGFWLRAKHPINWWFMGGLFVFWMLPLVVVVLLNMPRSTYFPFAACSITCGVISSAWLMYRKNNNRNAGDWCLIGWLLLGLLVSLHMVLSTTKMFVDSTTMGDIYLGFIPVLLTGISLFSLLSFTLEAIQDSIELARTDGLTGLLNRRAFDDELAIAVMRVERYRYPQDLSLITLDIDNFKHLNDTYGHPAGDRVIRAVSVILLNTSRRVDRVARIGGEEFAIVLSDTNSTAALRLAERLRQAISSDNSTGITCSASFGVACLQSTEKSPEALLHAADGALYAAKAAGRNCVRYALDPNRDPATIIDPLPASDSESH